MIDFIDKTSTVVGTPLDRAHLMGVQGFEAETVTFSGNTITKKTNIIGGTTEITFEADKIIKKFTGVSGKTITQTITFTDAGYTKELS